MISFLEAVVLSPLILTRWMAESVPWWITFPLLLLLIWGFAEVVPRRPL